MSLLQHFQPHKLHHAYCVLGDIVTNGEHIESHLRSILDTTYTIQRLHYDRFKIEDVSELRLQASQQGNKVCILEIAFALREAQNALLKTVEEPASGTHFIFCVPSEQTLLPTIQSRCEKISLSVTRRVTPEVEKIPLQKFLKQSKEDRLEFIKKESEDWTNEDILNFINNLERHLHTPLRGVENPNNDTVTIAMQLQTLEKLKSYLSSPSASLSMIMEMIALIV